MKYMSLIIERRLYTCTLSAFDPAFTMITSLSVKRLG